MRILANLWFWIVWLEQTWGVITWLFALPSTMLTAYSSIHAGLPLHMVLFYSVAVGFFVTLTVLGLFDAYFRYSTLYKFNVANMRPVHVMFNADDNYAFIQLGFQLINSSTRPVFYRVEVLAYSLQNKTNTHAEQHDLTALVAPSDANEFLLPVINEIRPGPIDGRLHLQIEYGTRSDALKYRLIYKASQMAYLIVEDRSPAVRMNNFVTEIRHELA